MCHSVLYEQNEVGGVYNLDVHVDDSLLKIIASKNSGDFISGWIEIQGGTEQGNGNYPVLKNYASLEIFSGPRILGITVEAYEDYHSKISVFPANLLLRPIGTRIKISGMVD